jgi:plastocyanin
MLLRVTSSTSTDCATILWKKMKSILSLVPDQHLDVNIPPKGKVVVAIAFPSSGVVRFFCKFHSAKGMNGELLTGDAKPQAVRSPK